MADEAALTGDLNRQTSRLWRILRTTREMLYDRVSDCFWDRARA